MYNFDEPFDRHGTDSMKWDRLFAAYGREDMIPMGLADMDFKTLPEAAEAIQMRAAHPCYGYTYQPEEYYESFTGWNRRRNHLEIKKEEIIGVPGIVCAASIVLMALTKPGDRILLCTPVYDPFFTVIRELERVLVTSELLETKEGYRFDFEDMEQKMQEGVQLLILCSPHNPVGRVWTRDELLRISELCRKYHVLVFSDDIHSDFILRENPYIPMAAVSEDAASRTVTAMSPSKTFNVSGLKTSVIFTRNPELFSRINRIKRAFHLGVGLFGITGLTAAYSRGDRYVDELCAYIRKNAEYAARYIQQEIPAVKAYVPEGTYFLWLDCRALDLPQKALVDRVIQAGVIPNNGSQYGPGGEGFIRLNLATRTAMVKEAMERLRTALV